MEHIKKYVMLELVNISSLEVFKSLLHPLEPIT
jgi:hypothetical protein